MKSPPDAEPGDARARSAQALEVWFDFASTYSYPALMQVESIAAQRGIGVAWRPIVLGAIFNAQGWRDSPFNLYPAKGRYMWRDMERLCAAGDLPYRRPSIFPRNGMLAARIVCANAEAHWVGSFVRQVFAANFVEDEDIADPQLINGYLLDLGLDGSVVIANATSSASKSRLRRQTEDAQNLGIFGAPTFVVGGELFWGNERMDMALAAATARVRA